MLGCMESWSIVLEKEYFKFSCAHFLIFPDGTKERLHGHNYRVRVEITGDLSDRGLVIDFIEAIAERTGLPVGVKSAIGELKFWEQLAQRRKERGQTWPCTKTTWVGLPDICRSL